MNEKLLEHLAWVMVHGVMHNCSCSDCSALRGRMKEIEAREGQEYYDEYIKGPLMRSRLLDRMGL